MKQSGERLNVDLMAESSSLTVSEAKRMGRIALSNALSLNEHHVTMEDFTDVYSPDKINSDQRYVRKSDEIMSSGEQNKLGLAQVFEQMFTSGVMLGNWLGNLTFEEGRGVVEHFDVDARNTLRYDDIRNKVDTFTTLTFPEPIEDEDFGLSTDKIVLGFDVTINSDRHKLLDKITRFYNGNQELPFGFSHLDYYSSESGHSRLPMLPRYTICIGASDVNAVMETARIRERDGTVDFGLFSGQDLINRFKVLSEIRAQNELCCPTRWNQRLSSRLICSSL